MNSLHLDRLSQILANLEPAIAMLWLGLAMFTAGLAILLYTRWGQYKPLRKCMAMSLLAHLLLAGYAATVEISAPPLPPPEQTIRVSIGDEAADAPAAGRSASAPAKINTPPWEMFHNDAAAVPEEAELDRGAVDEPAEPKRLARAEDVKLPGDPLVEHVAIAGAKPLVPVDLTAKATTPGESPTAIEVPQAQRRDAPPAAPPTTPASPERVAVEPAAQPSRTPSADVPAALLPEIVALPRMSETSAARAFEPDAAKTDRRRVRQGGRIAGGRFGV